MYYGHTMSQLEAAKVVKESEKAVMVSILFGDEFRKDVWFPKSQIKIEGGKVFASDWILSQKEKEAPAHFPAIATVFKAA